MQDILLSDIQQTFTNLKPSTINALQRLEIYNLRDLVFYKPVSYQVKNLNPNLSLLREGQLIQTEVVIDEVIIPAKRSLPIKIIASNDTGSILLVFFNKIPPFIFNRLKTGTKHIINGKVQFFDHYCHISHPEFILKKNLENELEPIYPLTYGLINKQLYSYITDALEILDKHPNLNIVTSELVKYINILHLYKTNVPPSLINQKWEEAIKYLATKELIANQLNLSLIRKQKHQNFNRSILKNSELQNTILNKLGFQLTLGQQKVIAEIEEDQKSHTQMMRLLQGDVGSGKTLVALMTMLNVAYLNHQSTLMAPTDLLANQHYQFFKNALEGTAITVELLTGKTASKDRKRIYSELENGDTKILIGTHALFQEKINFKDLVYIIIDEQHRFGVQQRITLVNKSYYPDVLVMTATPIPRSLTLTMFGDMNVSKLTTKPTRAMPIVTSVASNNKIPEIMLALNKKLQQEEKIYWVCPLISQNEVDDSEDIKQLMDVNARFLELEQIYGDKVGVLHGKMNAAQKDDIMNNFKDGKIQILVATTVIEVGIDVPDATLMIIENAEKFGLSALHQLRGRVGRSSKQSHCILIYNPTKLSTMSKQRLEIMKSSNDGFFIAEQDLILRGGGEILGTRQSGEPKFFFADLKKDIDILIQASKLGETIEINDDLNHLINIFSKPIVQKNHSSNLM